MSKFDCNIKSINEMIKCTQASEIKLSPHSFHSTLKITKVNPCDGFKCP